MLRVTNQARAVAAAAAAKYTQPQLSSFAKPSSLDVLSDSAASQVCAHPAHDSLKWIPHFLTIHLQGMVREGPDLCVHMQNLLFYFRWGILFCAG